MTRTNMCYVCYVLQHLKTRVALLCLFPTSEKNMLKDAGEIKDNPWIPLPIFAAYHHFPSLARILP